MFMSPKFTALPVHIKSLSIIAMAAWPIISICRGQEIILVSPSLNVPQANSHPAAIVDTIGPANTSNGTIISNGLAHWGDDVLNCDACRRRLGLPPLAVLQKVQQSNQPAVVTSPVGLSGLPLEARQQLMQGLSLPSGAMILSAKFIEISNQAGQSLFNEVNLTENANAAPTVPKILAPKIPITKIPVPAIASNLTKLGNTSPTVIQRSLGVIRSSTTSDSPVIQAKVVAPNLSEEASTPTVVIASDNPAVALESETETHPTQEPALSVSPSPPESIEAVEVLETAVMPPETTGSEAIANNSSSASSSPSDGISDAAMIKSDSPVIDTAINETANRPEVLSIEVAQKDNALKDNIVKAIPVDDDVPVAEVIAVANETSRVPVSASDAKSLVVDGVLRSPALQQIQIDFLKKQLTERDDLIRNINGMQVQYQQQMDSLARANEQLMKREQEMAREVQQTKVESQKVSQKQEVEVLSIRNELASVRQQAREQAMLLNDKLGEVNNAKVEEIVQLREELNAVRQSKLESVASIRADMTSTAELTARQDTQRIVDQQLMIETQIKSIAKLENQVESIQASQALDARRIGKLRKELKIVNEARLKVLEPPEFQPTKSTVVEETYISPAKSKLSESSSNQTAVDNPKAFQTPVPDIKSIKPKIPRIDNRTPSRTNTKAF